MYILDAWLKFMLWLTLLLKVSIIEISFNSSGYWGVWLLQFVERELLPFEQFELERAMLGEGLLATFYCGYFN